MVCTEDAYVKYLSVNLTAVNDVSRNFGIFKLSKLGSLSSDSGIARLIVQLVLPGGEDGWQTLK